MPVQHSGNPKFYGDALGPAFGNAPGAAAPTNVVFSAHATDATMDVYAPNFNENTEDRQYCLIQIDHDLHLPSSGNITFYPHIHWSFYAEPANDQTVIWKLSYVYAKGGTTLGNAGQFASAPTVLTATTYTTTAETEIRKHLISPFGSITIAASDCGPSMIFAYTYKLDTSSTIAANRVVALYVDFHYQKGPLGTITEYS